MVRHVSAVGFGLCLIASSLFAQTTDQQKTELTVKIASADVHKFAMIGSPVIAKVQSGTVLEITRNLGSWVEVRWPAADGGVAFLHVSSGSIARRAGTDPRTSMATAAVSPPVAATPVPSSLRTAQTAASDQGGSRRATYISLPRHVLGVGGRMGASAPRFGAAARAWWRNQLGLQVEVSRSSVDGVQTPGHMTSFQLAPSVLDPLPDGVSDSLWVRPYVGAGGNFYHATLTSGPSAVDQNNAVTDKGLGFQAFGGAEATFSGAPRFALSADFGYRWSQASFVGFDPSKVRFALSAHWYVR